MAIAAASTTTGQPSQEAVVAARLGYGVPVFAVAGRRQRRHGWRRGAGLLGVDNSVETARRHTAEVKSLVFRSGENLAATIAIPARIFRTAPSCSLCLTTNILPHRKRCSCSIPALEVQARSWSTTRRSRRHPGCGTRRMRSAGFPLMGVTGPISLNRIRSSLTSSAIGS
jgi:hypothetical protein